MRKIKFRGKDIRTGEYIYSHSIELEKIGSLDSLQPYLCTKNSVWIKCNPDTVEEFTGMYDIDGTEIYEGDIIQNISFPEVKVEVARHHGCWIIKPTDFDPDSNEYEILYETLRDFKYLIIGNIHDNPTLL